MGLGVIEETKVAHQYDYNDIVRTISLLKLVLIVQNIEISCTHSSHKSGMIKYKCTVH